MATREHHVNFKHDLFDKLTLVGQVDKKFIAMSMNKNLDSSADNPDKELLLLFDQHAVHERVRIEQLLEGDITILQKLSFTIRTAFFFDRFSANRVFDFAETLSFLFEY